MRLASFGGASDKRFPLGFIIFVLRYSSRKCGLRRELEQTRGAVATGSPHDAWTQTQRPRSDMTARKRAESPHHSAMRSTPESCQRFAGNVPCQSVICRESVYRPPPPAGHGLRSAMAVAARKSSLRRLATRRAPGTLICRNLCAPRNLAAFNPMKGQVSAFVEHPSHSVRRTVVRN